MVVMRAIRPADVPFPLATIIGPVLTALADAGLLLPPGGETRVEWAVRVDVPVPGRKEHPGDIMTHLGEEKSRRCREVWEGWTPLRRSVTSWPNGSVHTGPWCAVDALDATTGAGT